MKEYYAVGFVRCETKINTAYIFLYIHLDYRNVLMVLKIRLAAGWRSWNRLLVLGLFVAVVAAILYYYYSYTR